MSIDEFLSRIICIYRTVRDILLVNAPTRLLSSGGEESCPSIESLVNWLLEHDDSMAGLADMSDDSDILLSYIDDSWSDRESMLMDDLPDDEVHACYLSGTFSVCSLRISMLQHVRSAMCIDYDVVYWVIF